jgi:hypothetical protein
MGWRDLQRIYASMQLRGKFSMSGSRRERLGWLFPIAKN